MPKVTLKSVQEYLAIVQKDARKFVDDVRNPKRILSSTTDGTQKTVDGAKGQAMVSINDLIATVRTAEQTGYITVLRVTNGGKSLEVWFQKNPSETPAPNTFYF